MKSKFILGMICSFGFLLSCTEKGCQDESALNYQVTATVDDGSCIYCVNNETDKGTLILEMEDERNGSIHFNDQIVRIEANQTIEIYNDGGCGQNGCFMSLRIQNLISEDITGLNFSIQYTSPTGGTFTQHYFQAMNVKSGQTLVKPNIFLMPDANCPSIANGTAQAFLFDATYL